MAAALLLCAFSGAARTQDQPPVEPPTDAPGEQPTPEPPAAEQPAAEQPAAESPAEPEPAPAPTARQSTSLPPAEAFGDNLRAALLQENQVQEYERTTIGLEDPAKLTGFKLERRQRVERDLDFNLRVRQFSFQPLELPGPAEIASANLTRQQITLLSGLRSAYESSRTDPQVNQMSNLNRRFLQNGDWTLRDQAIKMREALIEREITFNQLAEQARALVAGQLADADVAAMEAALYAVAPELQEQKPDISALVLQDPALAAQVLGELQATISQPRPVAVQPPPAAELWPNINALQKKLVFTAGLDEVIAEHKALSTELESLDEKIVQSEQWTDLEARMALVERKVEVSLRRDELTQAWNAVDPDEQLYSQLIGAQDQLIRRLMLDIGAGGALFATRRDGLVAMVDGGLPPSADERWRLLIDQQDLLEELNAAQPVPDPLEAIEMLPDMPPIAVKPVEPKPDPQATAKPKPKPKPKPKAKPPPKPKAKPAAKPAAKPKGKGKPPPMFGSKPRS